MSLFGQPGRLSWNSFRVLTNEPESHDHDESDVQPLALLVSQPRRYALGWPVVITVSETPRLANRAERRAYQALLEQLQPNDPVIPGQRVTDHLKDHEVDFVVAIEGAGIVCLEVKGGEVWHDGAGWCQLRGGKQVQIEPVRQAREACYALRD